jgi:hypothetical protein
MRPATIISILGESHLPFSKNVMTETRVVFTKHGREDDHPAHARGSATLKRASTGQDEHVAAPGLLSRVVALLRGQ